MASRDTLVTLRTRALVLCCLLASASASASSPAAAQDAAPSAADRDRSRAAFRRGVGQLRAQDFPAARASFEEAWQLVPHPSILLNLGISRLRTDDPVLAEQDLQRFLTDDAGASPEEQASAREALAEARAKIGTMRFTVTPPGARIAVDGKVATSDTARVRAGTHGVVVTAEGYIQDERSVDVPPKADVDVRVTLARRPIVARADAEPSSDGPSARTVAGWSTAGLSAVALLGAGVLGLRAMSLSNDYESPTSPSFQNPDVKDEGVAFRTGADIALVVGIVTGVTAAVLLLGRDAHR